MFDRGRVQIEAGGAGRLERRPGAAGQSERLSGQGLQQVDMAAVVNDRGASAAASSVGCGALDDVSVARALELGNTLPHRSLVGLSVPKSRHDLDRAVRTLADHAQDSVGVRFGGNLLLRSGGLDRGVDELPVGQTRSRCETLLDSELSRGGLFLVLGNLLLLLEERTHHRFESRVDHE